MSKQKYVTFDTIRSWASERGLYRKGNPITQFAKLQEETGELARGLLKKDKEMIIDSIGDAVVVLTNLAHLCGFQIEDCIDHAYNEIKDREGSMINGTFVKKVGWVITPEIRIMLDKNKISDELFYTMCDVEKYTEDEMKDILYLNDRIELHSESLKKMKFRL